MYHMPTNNPEKFIPAHTSKSFETFPFFWITRTHGKYINLIEKSLKNINIDNTKRKILLTVEALGEPNITEIANFAYMKLTTTTKSVYKLQEQGLLTCFSSPKDERITIVNLTSEGRKVIEKLHQINLIALSGVFSQFDEGELDQLNSMLVKLYNLLPD